MREMLQSLYYRLSSEAYNLSAVVVELILIGLCVNWCASLLQATRGTRPLRGVMIILVAVTLVVRVITEQFQWVRLDLLYRYILYGLAFIALVVFQPELRRAIIRVGDVRLRRASGSPQSPLVAALVKSAGYLSRNKYGALIAIQRGVDLTGWAENGTLIRADVSANLLNAIFFPNSPLHDLAVIIRDARVLAANCQFPSAESDEVNIALGSRHLAAVGMSYETDALVLVVSEETGVISLADNGKLTRFLSLDDLADELTQRLGGSAASRERSAQGLALRVLRTVRRVAVVVPLTVIIWYVADQATFLRDTFPVKLELRQEDPSTREVAVNGPPLAFEATFSGPGRAIDRLRATHGNQPLRVAWTVPKAYEARPEPYTIDSRAEIEKIIAGSRELTQRGLSVVDVTLPSLSFSVYELTSVTIPVRVKAEGGAVRIAVESIEPPTVEARVRSDDRPTLEAQGFVLATLGQQVDGLVPGERKSFAAVPLNEPTGLLGSVHFTPNAVDVTVRVVAHSQTVKNVPVRLFVAPEVADRYEVRKNDLNEWRTDVEVQGDEAVFDPPAPLSIEAFVHITADLVPPAGAEAPEEQLRTLDVTFLTPKGVSVIERRSVRVTLVPRAGVSQ